MILCDNKTCDIKWFHFNCVNLTTKPKGKWFCPMCRENRNWKISMFLLFFCKCLRSCCCFTSIWISQNKISNSKKNKIRQL